MDASEEFMLVYGLGQEVIRPAHDSADAVVVASETGE
jgi:hypothetical protein